MINKGTIVIIDNDVSFRISLAQSLNTSGYIVDILSDSSQILTRVNAGEVPSVILLGVVFPGDGGMQFIKEIKTLAPYVPVIMLSRVDDVRTVVEAMKLGASDFLLKPFEGSALQAAIDNALAPAARGSGSGYRPRFEWRRHR